MQPLLDTQHWARPFVCLSGSSWWNKWLECFQSTLPAFAQSAFPLLLFGPLVWVFNLYWEVLREEMERLSHGCKSHSSKSTESQRKSKSIHSSEKCSANPISWQLASSITTGIIIFQSVLSLYGWVCVNTFAAGRHKMGDEPQIYNCGGENPCSVLRQNLFTPDPSKLLHYRGAV